MRVLHVIPSVSPHHGGPSVALPLMVQALQDIGVAVDVATTDDDGPGKRLNVPLGVPVAYGSGSIFYFRKQTEFYKVAASLRKWLKANVTNYDVVHVHALFSYTSDVAASVARKAGIPYVIRPLGVLNRYGMKQRRALLKRFSFRWIEGPLLRDASAVHFTSEAEKCEAESLGIRLRPVIIPLGIKLPAENDNRTKEPVVLFLSRLDPKKNLDGLLNAWALTLADGAHDSWRLVIAGDGPPEYKQALRQLADSLGIENRVDWVGQITGAAKDDLLSRAAVYVLPSFSENFGIAAVEAMAAGLPSILGEGVAVAREAAQAQACIITTPDAESISAKLCELMDNIELRNELAAASRRFVTDSYGLDRMGARLMTLYQNIKTPD